MDWVWVRFCDDKKEDKKGREDRKKEHEDGRKTLNILIELIHIRYIRFILIKRYKDDGIEMEEKKCNPFLPLFRENGGRNLSHQLTLRPSGSNFRANMSRDRPRVSFYPSNDDRKRWKQQMTRVSTASATTSAYTTVKNGPSKQPSEVGRTTVQENHRIPLVYRWRMDIRTIFSMRHLAAQKRGSAIKCLFWCIMCCFLRFLWEYSRSIVCVLSSCHIRLRNAVKFDLKLI